MKRFGILLSIFVLINSGSAYGAEPVLTDYTNIPLFMTESVPPNILIILDNSGSMNREAYNESYIGVPYHTISTLVYSAADDAEEKSDCGAVDCVTYTSSVDLDLGMDSASFPNQITGIRFKNLQIERGATIDQSYIKFNANSVFSGTQQDLLLAVHGQLIGDAPVIGDLALNLSGRTNTTARVSWTLPAWNTVGGKHNTPELKTIIEEIVARPDWTPGNSILFLFTNPLGNPVSGRHATARDTSSPEGPQLYVKASQDSAVEYYGYFNPEFFYVWSSSSFIHKYKKVSYEGDPAGSGYWKVLGKDGSGDFTIPHNLLDTEIETGDSTGLWDGNWINWLTMRRTDVLRKVLYGGLATSRQGGGNSTNIGEDATSTYYKTFDATSMAGVSPYTGSVTYTMYNGNFQVGGSTYPIKVDKEVRYEPQDFFDYDSGDNLAGVLQKVGDRARWGNEMFLYGDGTNKSGGEIKTTIGGGSMPSLITELQNIDNDTWTPLAEAYYVAMQYYKQEVPVSGLDFKTSAFPIGQNQDPYYNGSQYVDCAKSFVILLTDGASTKDKNIPDFLKDYDGDGDDGTFSALDGSNYLDDIALYARTQDLRSDLGGDQNIYLYTVYAFDDDDNARQLLKDAAKNGGFDDLDGDNVPDGDYGAPEDDRREWDKNGDNIPDTYYEARDGGKLEEEILKAITDILRRAASGTAVSVLSTSGEGEGNLVQAYFKPVVTTGVQDARWVGYLQSLWVDERGNMREDTNQNKRLDIASDFIIAYTVVNGETRISRFEVTTAVPYPDITTESPVETVAMEEIAPLWEAGKILAARNPDERTIFTYIDIDDDRVIDEISYNHSDSVGEMISFTQANASLLRPYLGIESTATWGYLGDTAANRAENIVAYVRGSDDGFSGNTDALDIRMRNVDGRVWKLGDIVYSTPTSVSFPTENYDLIYSDESFAQFHEAMKDRETMVYVGGNDGMLHAFTSWIYNSSTTSYSQPFTTTEQIGDEVWAYIPHALLPHLKWLAGNNYTHVDYANLQPKVFNAKILADEKHYTDAGVEKNWGTFLLLGLNMGGRHIWASGDYDGDAGTPDTTRHFYPSYTCIDVTDPRNPEVLWERTYATPSNPTQSADNNTDLGLTTSYPAIVKVGERWFAVFGSGPGDYDGNSTEKGHVFVVDLLTGVPEKNLSSNSDWLFETSENSAFMGSPVSLDKGLSYSVDGIYIGETYKSGANWAGAMYKIVVPRDCPFLSGCLGDLKNLYGDNYDDPNSALNPWILSKMFDSPEPITAPATLSVDDSGNTWVFFGTGRFFSQDDKAYSVTQYLFGIKDPFYNSNYNAVADSDTYYYDYSKSVTLSSSNLLNSDSFVVLEGGPILLGSNTYSLSDLRTKISTVDGWYRTLTQNSKERSLTKPSIIGGITLFSTYTPEDLLCSYGGESNLYGLYYETGTAATAAVFENGTYTDADGNVVIKDSMSIGKGLSSSTTLHVGQQPDGKVSGFIQKSTGEVMELKIDPFIKVRSGIKLWREK